MAYILKDDNEMDTTPVSEEELKKIGVDLLHVDIDDTSKIDELIKSYDMNFHDEVHINPETMPNYEQNLKTFFEEHLHTDAELRIIKKGTGFFDIRGIKDEWIRIPVKPGCFIYLPAGIYHRFAPSRDDHVSAIRLFRKSQNWVAYNRNIDGDEKIERKNYVKAINSN